jgi:hypothetical protein
VPGDYKISLAISGKKPFTQRPEMFISHSSPGKKQKGRRAFIYRPLRPLLKEWAGLDSNQ